MAREMLERSLETYSKTTKLMTVVNDEAVSPTIRIRLPPDY